ncbi:MAG: LppX_LprAFG lipoprotein [Anaerolineae bacterium]|nr:LppX_LprAFG lipoprotein [Anaerolineae bacterium]
MKKLWMLCGFWFMLLVVGCTSNPTPQAPPDVRALLNTAADILLNADTFQLEINQTGTPYVFTIDIGQGQIETFLRRVVGQFIAPDEVYATANVVAGSLPIDLILYGKADDQWFNPSGLTWVNAPFADGFDPRRVVGEDSGFRKALSSLSDLQYIGIEDFFGVQVHHIKGVGNAADVSALLVGMIEFTTPLPLDVYLRVEDTVPVRMIITQPETATADTADTQWTIEVFDIDGAKNFTAPTGE